MTTIDARGLGCPKPVLIAEEELGKIKEGIVELLVDNEGSAENLAVFARNNSLYSETIKEDDHWRVKIVKGYACRPEISETIKKSSKEFLLVIGTDTIGKDEELGRILIKGIFETMRVTKEVPDMIFFLNAGVKLTTVNEEVIYVLKEIETMGVEIFSCGTCLKYYGLESELKVGYRGTTNHIVEGMKDFSKTVWIG